MKVQIGEIQGKVDHASFFMGILSKNYGFGPVAEQDYPEAKVPHMHIEIEGMPEKLIIRRRGGKPSGMAMILASASHIP